MMSPIMCVSKVCVSCHIGILIMSHKKRLFSFFSFRPRNVKILMSVPRFRAKHLLLTQLLHRGIQLISIIHHHCPELDYTGISDMESILCNIYLILSEVLYDNLELGTLPLKNWSCQPNVLRPPGTFVMLT